MINKGGINFEGAKFFVNGRTSNVLPDGAEVNIRHQLNITLSDGTQFIKSIWYPFNWERWIDKKQHYRYADIGGFYRKVSPRQAILLQKAWDEYQERAA
ncbi:TPA: hypothetical protein ACNH1V_000480 [Citrobacter koseri]|nr:hypothetical protein [Citrobacter koseri]